jgi:pyrroline-5-carboxylate reductase
MNSARLATGFIGAGNMGQALIAGLVQGGMAAARIGIAEPDSARAVALQQRFPGLVALPAEELAAQADTLVLAVKPQILPELAPKLAASVAGARPLVVSVAAGIGMRQLAAWLGPETRIVRAMPNTPALIGAGITGLFAGENTDPTDRETAERLLGAVGATVWVDREEQMHAVTATSGSGPAYVFLLIEAMTEAATRLGLEPETARQLTLATAAGAARLAAESPESAAELRARVTSPGGTTERAVAVFRREGFADMVDAAMQAATERSRELGG